MRMSCLTLKSSVINGWQYEPHQGNFVDINEKFGHYGYKIHPYAEKIPYRWLGIAHQGLLTIEDGFSPSSQSLQSKNGVCETKCETDQRL